jgi:hypothetical protein
LKPVFRGKRCLFWAKRSSNRAEKCGQLSLRDCDQFGLAISDFIHRNHEAHRFGDAEFDLSAEGKSQLDGKRRLNINFLPLLPLPGSILQFIDPLSDMERTVLELCPIGLAAAQKFNSIRINERHVPQIQNQLPPRCLGREQFLELFDILGFHPATECEQDLTVPCSPGSQHANSLRLKKADAATLVRNVLKQCAGLIS